MARAYIAIGSNIKPARNVWAALLALVKRVQIVSISTVYCSEALDRPEQPRFYNCVAEAETDLAPLVLKREVLRPIEAGLGRERSADKYAARTIDLDLIVYGNSVLDTKELVLPDPQITKRPFLLIPLSELAPELVLPGRQTTLEKLAANWPRANIQARNAYTRRLRRKLASIIVQ